MNASKLVDNFNRHLNYLRISITDRCNLQCRYCEPKDLIPKLSHADILTYEEILRVVRIATRLGISKVRVTGGEPLVRDDLARLTERLPAALVFTSGVGPEHRLRCRLLRRHDPLCGTESGARGRRRMEGPYRGGL